jgi:formamidopyrimidine-DNA glycosylase
VPELPDVVVYVESLRRHVAGEVLERVRLASPFVLRTVEPPLAAVTGKRVREVERLGKRIVLAFDDELYLVVHLMIAGRLRWRTRGARPPGKLGLAAFDFRIGTLLLTEAASKKRAALHVVRSRRRGSRCSTPISRSFATRFSGSAIPSSARSPIRGS